MEEYVNKLTKEQLVDMLFKMYRISHVSISDCCCKKENIDKIIDKPFEEIYNEDKERLKWMEEH